MSVDFTLPDLGEGIHEAQVITVAVKEGDVVAEDDTLMEVETDKAAVEIPSPQAGTIERVHVQPGQVIHVGDSLITFGGTDAAAPAPTKKEKVAAHAAQLAHAVPQRIAPGPVAPAAAPAGATAVAAPPRSRTNGPVPASPAVRRRARENQVDLHAVPATGPGGRVTREDLDAFLGAGGAAPAIAAPVSPAPLVGAPAHPPVLAPRPAPPMQEPVAIEGTPGTDNYGPITRQPITQIRKTIATQMVRSYSQIPHVLHAEQVDVTQLDEFRRGYRKEGLPGSDRLTLTPFIVKSVVNALRAHPKFNCSLDADSGELVFKRYYNIGMAVDTPRGLVVPVVRNVDAKSVLQLALEYAEIAGRIRTTRFSIDELRGGTFTITNIGALGGLFFTPIINFPEVAILGIGRSRPTPVVRDGEIVVRTMMPLCLSFDHRVCDGAEAARFANDIIAQLEDPIRLAL